MKKYKKSCSILHRERTGSRGWLLAGLGLIAFATGAYPALAEGGSSPFAGIYIGAHAGSEWSDASFSSDPYSVVLPTDTVPVPGRSDKFDLNGGLIGGHLGYNIVTSGKFLFGIEGDLTHLGHKDKVDSFELLLVGGFPFELSYASELELDWQATIRGRMGYVAGNTMFYGTAGIAFLNVDWKETATADDGQAFQTFVQNHSASKTLTGFVVGAGLEFALLPNVLLGAEYLYENFGSFGSVPFGHTDPAQLGRIDDIDMHSVRARISFKFGHEEPHTPLK